MCWLVLSDQPHGPGGGVGAPHTAENDEEAAVTVGGEHDPPHGHSEHVPMTLVPDNQVETKITCLYSTT